MTYIDSIKVEGDALPIVGKPISSISTTNSTVLSTSGTILDANSGRRYCRIQNLGDWDVHLNLGGTAKVGYGIRLTIGQSYEITEANRYTGVITGISTTAGQVVSVQYG